MTGLEFSNVFDLETDKAYSGYLDSTKKNRLFKKALIESVERKYRESDNQKQRDELAFIIGTDEAYYTTNNEIYVKKLQITNVVASGLTITVTTAYSNNLTNGDSVTISGVVGTLTFAADVNITATVSNVTTYTFDFTVASVTGVYTSGGELTVNGSKMVSTYEHLLAAKTTYTKTLGTATVIPKSTATVTLAANNYNLRTGEYVLLSGASTNASLNGFWYVKALSSTRFELYSNPGLTETIALITELGTVTMKRVFEYWTKPYYSDKKINVFETPTVIFPKVETANNKLKFYPKNETLYWVHLDYMKIPPVYIDSADNVINLEDYYPLKFLYYIIGMAKEMFAAETRDMGLYQTSNNDIIQNP